jgi:hypothetical protein
MSFFRLFALAPLLVLVACGHQTPRNKHINSQTAAILSTATRVEVYRIDGRNDPPDPTPIAPGDPTVGGYAITGRGKDQGKEFARKLADVLLDDSTYSDSFAACFWPGVAFRVYQADDCVDLVICFKCHNFYLGPPSERRVMETASFIGTPASTKLIQLAKEAFPEDAEIGALKEE